MTKKINHEFVKTIPNQLEANTLYVSLDYSIAVHKCFCGCGNEVTTPLSPTDWKIMFDGKHISLNPSVGSWNLECRSHYWIENNKVYWAEGWSDKRISAAQAYDRGRKENYYKGNGQLTKNQKDSSKKLSDWEKLKNWIDKLLLFKT